MKAFMNGVINKFYFRSFFICFFLLSAIPSHICHAKKNVTAEQKPIVIADTAGKKLYLIRDGAIENIFSINIGKNGVNKTKEGDMKTPLGEYKIAWMVSRHGNKGKKIIDKKTWCKDSKLYYGSSGPEGEELWSEAYGGKDAAVMGLNYPNKKDLKNGYTGSCIEIHAGRHRKPEPINTSAGCIKLYPDDALVLYNKVNVGTKIYIVG